MGILDRLLPQATKANRAQRLVDPFVGGMVSPRYKDYHSYLSAFKSPWVKACVSVIAYNAANVEYKLYQGDAGDDEHEITSSPLLQLLARPNPLQTGFQLIESIFIDLELTGNCFVALEEQDGRGRPAEMYRLSPDCVTVLPDPVKMVAGYVYTVNGKAIKYQPEELLHLKSPNPLSELYGMGTIEAAEARFDSELAMAEHERQFWRNGAKITGVLTTDGAVDDKVFARLRDNIRNFFRGSGYSTLMLENGLKYQSVSDGPAKLGMLEMSKASRDMILAMFGVPPTKLGILENANYKAQASDEFFWCFTAGTPITVKDRGPVPIEEIGVGDLLLTHEGRYRPVVEARSREYRGRLFTITLAKHAAPLEVSEEHPFYVQRDGREEWVKVGALRVGDMVLGRRLVAEEADPVRSIPTVPANGRGARPLQEVTITPQLAHLIGLYLAEGHLVRRPNGEPERVDFTFSADEHDLIGAAVEGLTLFGKATAGQPTRGAVRVSGGRLAAELLQQFGENAGTKHIPDWLLAAPDSVLSATIAGYWAGDGMVERYRLRASTVSPRLAHDLRLALTRFGAVPSLRVVAAHQKVSNGSTINAREAHIIELTGEDAAIGRRIVGESLIEFDPRGRAGRGGSAAVDERFVSYRIEAIAWRRAQGERIYNMEVAEDHSYTAAGVLAHNTETIDPKLTRLEQELQRLVDLFHPGAGYRLAFDRLNFSDDLPTATVAKLLNETNSMTINELREYRGAEGIGPEGDVILVPSTMVPLDQALAPPQALPAPTLLRALPDPNAPPEQAMMKKLLRVGGAAPASAAIVAKHRDALLSAAERTQTALVAEAFAAQERAVLAAVAGYKRRKAALRVEDIWPDDTGLGEAVRGVHLAASEAAYGTANALGIGVSFDLANPLLEEFVGQLADRVTGINDTTKGALDEQINEGLRRGYSTDQIARGVPGEGYKGITGVFEDAKGYRATMIARTESMAAYQGAAIIAYGAAGIDRVELLDGTDDPVCAARNGKIVTLTEAKTIHDHPNGSLCIIPIVAA